MPQQPQSYRGLMSVNIADVDSREHGLHAMTAFGPPFHQRDVLSELCMVPSEILHLVGQPVFPFY